MERDVGGQNPQCILTIEPGIKQNTAYWWTGYPTEPSLYLNNEDLTPTQGIKTPQAEGWT